MITGQQVHFQLNSQIQEYLTALHAMEKEELKYKNMEREEKNNYKSQE